MFSQMYWLLVPIFTVQENEKKKIQNLGGKGFGTAVPPAVIIGKLA